jgi:predicted amidophosphoribosyltransferase
MVPKAAACLKPNKFCPARRIKANAAGPAMTARVCRLYCVAEKPYQDPLSFFASGAAPKRSVSSLYKYKAKRNICKIFVFVIKYL